MNQIDEMADDVLAGSWRCRRFNGATRRWVLCCMAEWEAEGSSVGYRERWAARSLARYKEEYGNPMLIWWIASIVIQLIIKWWLTRTVDEMSSRREEACDYFMRKKGWCP